MQTGLQKAGMSNAESSCCSEALAAAVPADAFNQVAAYLNEGRELRGSQPAGPP